MLYSIYVALSSHQLVCVHHLGLCTSFITCSISVIMVKEIRPGAIFSVSHAPPAQYQLCVNYIASGRCIARMRMHVTEIEALFTFSVCRSFSTYA